MPTPLATAEKDEPVLSNKAFAFSPPFYVCLFQPFLSPYYIPPKQLYKCALQFHLLKIDAYLELFTFSLWLILKS